MDSIVEWITLGRSVLLSKTYNLSMEEEYRPMTCLNTSYKIYIGILAKYIKKRAVPNNMEDESQIGTTEGDLGTTN